MKTCEEWSVAFDLMYNNISSDKAPGLNEYEKSVFLSRAQEAIVIGLYNGSLGDAFEATEALSIYLAPLVKQKLLMASDEIEAGIPSGSNPYIIKIAGKNSHVFLLPSDLLFRTFESCTLMKNGCATEASVLPVTQDEYWRTSRNPFKGTSSNKVLRLTHSMTMTIGSVEPEYVEATCSELVVKSGYSISSYLVRYIKRPEPIILEDLDGLNINGENKAQTCKLDEAIHSLILSEAVKLANEAWTA